MPDERSPKRRKRTFSTTSTISSDDRLDASEQIVEDVTLEFFYHPRSISALVCLVAYLVYSAFTRDPSASVEDNIWSGVVSLVIVFLVLSLLVMPNGPFTRPHPAVWRLVFGCSVLYLMFLSFALCLTRDEFRKILFFLDPELKDAGPDTKEYAVNCSQISWTRLWGHCDIFLFAHFFGWALKAMLIRHAGLCWTASIMWELTEVFFSHLLPNFQECWWDAIVLDILLSNGLGIQFGLYICKKLEMRNHHWESIKDIQTTTGKIRRAFMQFTPHSWTHVRWMDPKCSYMRFFAISQMVIVSQIVELNTFFLKHILYIPNPHWLNWYRIILISLIVAPSIRQYYIYVTDTRSKRVGTQCWVLIAITVLELLICVKYGAALFKRTDVNFVLIILWILVQLVISLGVLYFMVMHRSKSSRRRKSLEEIPTEDPVTKTINYLKSNGHNKSELKDVASISQVSHTDPAEHSTYREEAKSFLGLKQEFQVTSHTRRSRRSEVVENDGIQTRLRSRKSKT